MSANTVVRYGDGTTRTFDVPGSESKVVSVGGLKVTPQSTTFNTITFAVAPGRNVPIEVDYSQIVPANPSLSGTEVSQLRALMARGGIGWSWSRLPDARLYAGESLFCRDLGVHGALATSNGVRWGIGGPIVLSSATYAVDDCTDVNTSDVVMHRCLIPPFLMQDRYSLLVSARAEWPGSTTTKTLKLFISSGQVGLTNNGGSASVLGAKWENMRISNLNGMLNQLGEAGGSAGVWAQQSAAFLTGAANTQTYFEASIRAAWGTAGAGSNRITLRSCEFVITPG